jgi:hypothetical protein
MDENLSKEKIMEEKSKLQGGAKRKDPVEDFAFCFQLAEDLDGREKASCFLRRDVPRGACVLAHQIKMRELNSNTGNIYFT